MAIANLEVQPHMACNVLYDVAVLMSSTLNSQFNLSEACAAAFKNTLHATQSAPWPTDSNNPLSSGDIQTVAMRILVTLAWLRERDIYDPGFSQQMHFEELHSFLFTILNNTVLNEVYDMDRDIKSFMTASLPLLLQLWQRFGDICAATANLCCALLWQICRDNEVTWRDGEWPTTHAETEPHTQAVLGI